MSGADAVDLRELLNGLNARTYPISDGDPEEDLSARHLVDLFGVTIDVRRTKGGLVIDINTDDMPEEQGPVTVNLGDSQLTDDGRWMHITPAAIAAAQGFTTTCGECGAEAPGELLGVEHAESCSLNPANAA